jgi:hypothetical protein
VTRPIFIAGTGRRRWLCCDCQLDVALALRELGYEPMPAVRLEDR